MCIRPAMAATDVSGARRAGGQNDRMTGYCDWISGLEVHPKKASKPRGGEKLAEVRVLLHTLLFRLSFSRFPRLSRPCLRHHPLRPRHSACPPSPARARRRKSTSTWRRNQAHLIHPALALAVLAPEVLFLHPSVHLTRDHLSPALPRTPPQQRSPMPNRGEISPLESPPEPKSSLFRRTRNHTTIFPNWHPSLIVLAQSSLVVTPSEASLVTDGGWVWAAKTKTRTTSSQR